MIGASLTACPYFFVVPWNGSVFMASKTIKFIFLLLIIAGCWSLGHFLNVDLAQYKPLLLQYPLILSGVIFIALYVITTNLIWLGPKDILRLLAAVIYGPIISTIFVWLSELINACLLFHLSRFLGREFIEQKFKISSREVERAQSNKGILGIVAIRLNPLIPLRFQDLCYGLTEVPFGKYLAVITIATFPRLLWLQSILSSVGDAIFKDYNFVLGYFLSHPFILYYSGIYFAAVAVISCWAIALNLKKKRKK